MKTVLNCMSLLALILPSFTASALEFTTDCVSGSSARNTNGVYTIANGLHLNNGKYTGIGHQNASHVTTYLWAGMPAQFFTGATIVCPVTLRGTLKTANMDIWFMGTTEKGWKPGNPYSNGWHTYDDLSPITNESSVVLINNREPVKVMDNAVKAGESVNWGAGQFIGTKEFSSDAFLTQIGLSFNRGAKSTDYLFLRFTPDFMGYNDGEFRFSGYSTEQVAISNKLEGTNYAAMHVRYSAPDNVPSPNPQLSAEEQACETYIRSTVNWVQYRDSDGKSGFSYPAYCGVKDGKPRDLFFTIDAPVYTLTNAYLTLNALPPFTGTVPKGAAVSLSLVGFADASSADEDFVVTDAMFDGQTPVLLQENVLRGGLSAGKSLFTDGVGQRNLIRALNARVKEAAMVQKLGYTQRGGKKAVFRLTVENAGNEGDWGFSIGSAATPGVEAFFEAVEYRKRIKLFTNTGFEDGLTNWTLPSSVWTEEQAAIVEDPIDPSNHCLRFSITNFTASGSLEVYQDYRGDVEALRGRPYYISYRVYMPSSAPIKKRGTALTEFGYWLFWGREVDALGAVSNKQIEFAKSAEASTSCDQWISYSTTKFLADNITEILRIYMQFRFGEIDKAANEGDTLYYDDVTVEFEDFYDYPKERKMFHLIVR